MADASNSDPDTPQPQALMVLRSLTGIVDQATVLATQITQQPSLLEEMPPPVRIEVLALCDAVFDMDYRTTGIGGRSPDSLPRV